MALRRGCRIRSVEQIANLECVTIARWLRLATAARIGGKSNRCRWRLLIEIDDHAAALRAIRQLRLNFDFPETRHLLARIPARQDVVRDHQPLIDKVLLQVGIEAVGGIDALEVACLLEGESTILLSIGKSEGIGERLPRSSLISASGHSSGVASTAIQAGASAGYLASTLHAQTALSVSTWISHQRGLRRCSATAASRTANGRSQAMSGCDSLNTPSHICSALEAVGIC